MGRYTRHQLDPNHRTIRDGLKAIGASVDSRGPLDLLVGFRGVNYLLEVKAPGSNVGRRKLRPSQAKFLKGWQGQADVVRTLDDALEAIGAVSSLGSRLVGVLKPNREGKVF